MRLVIADDAPLVRSALAALLTAHGFDVVAEAGSPSDAVAAALRDRPDAVLMDVRMPPTYSIEGMEAARAIRARVPQVGVLLLSHHIEVTYLATLLATPGAGGSATC